ncbi:MAG: transposase [Cyclobacteriaceae bacterium]|nr:transposase [Cyclobacteriaceae bacterium]
MDLGELYFWTATINGWQKLLEKDSFKDIIISSLKYLCNKGKIDVFAFVIMPNHIHLIWRINELNGKETPQGSLLKYTAHEFKKMLSQRELEGYAVSASNKQYEFWQRDPLAIHLYTQKVAYQKLDYIHNNPIAGNWRLVNNPRDYKYSTAGFYELDVEGFSFVKDLREEF